MENNEKLFEITFAMMKEQKRKLMLDDFLYLNDNLSVGQQLAEDDELKKSELLMPMKFMFTLVVICKRGHLDIEVNLMEMHAEENDVVLITPGSIIGFVRPSADVQLLMMGFGDDADTNALNFASASMRKFFIRPALFHGNSSDMDEVTQIYKLMRHTIQKQSNKEYIREAILHYLGALTCIFKMEQDRFIKEQNYQKPSRREEILLNFLQEVHDHCQESRDLKFYADRLCLSPSYLAHIISETSGKHASEWIKDAVILEAKAMLRTGSYTVQQVSLALNFPNQSFFGKYFKAAVGISPRQYQQRE